MTNDLVYRAYGLRIGSELPLPELPLAEDEADLFIRIARANGSSASSLPPLVRVVANGEEVDLEWDEAGRAVVRGGREIEVHPVPGAAPEAVRALVVGRALPIALVQRGLFVLHASAVAIDGKVVALAARQGQGKSTLAAFLRARGHELVSDDVVALELDGEALVLPGVPQLKLWPDAVDHLGLPADQLRQVRPSIDKRLLRVSESFAASPLPLEHVYVLASGEKVESARLSPREAAVALVPCAWGARTLLSPAAQQVRLAGCAALAGLAPVSRLSRPPDLDRLDEAAALVEADIDRSRWR